MGQRLLFGDHVLDCESGELRRGGEPVSIQPQAVALLVYLARRPHTLVPKDALMAHLWPDVTVTDASLHQVVRRLRRNLGDASLLLTEPRRGLRFVADVEVVVDGAVSETYCIGNLGGVLAITGHLEQSVERFVEARDKAEDLGNLAFAARLQMLSGMAWMYLERWAEAEAAYADAQERAEQLGQIVEATEVALRQAQLACRMGAAPSLQDLDLLVGVAESGRQGWLLGEALAVRGEVALHVGALDIAEADARRSLRLARERWSACDVADRLCLLAETARARGDALQVEVSVAEVGPIVDTIRCTPVAPCGAGSTHSWTGSPPGEGTWRPARRPAVARTGG